MKLIIPKHKKNSHKGENGKVLIVGGSEDYTGTLALAGLAALRTGVDIVTIACPEKVGWAINSLSADLITKKFKCDSFTKKDVRKVLALSKNFDVVQIGNGLTLDKKALEFAKEIIKNVKNPLVVDADGIKAIGIKDVNNAIITPHILELALFLENSGIKYHTIRKVIAEKNIIKKARLIQKIIDVKNNVILLKGPTDIIITKNRVAYVKGGNERLAVAGTGDILAGLTAGFLAQKLEPVQAAYNASYINKKIGDYLKKKKGYSYIASDMIDDYCRVMRWTKK